MILSACAYNSATGRREFNLVSEAEEQRLGAQADRELRDAIPELSENPGLTALCSDVGLQLAAVSERAGPWKFRVLDEPTLNAFAVPGGFVYVTRGLLAYLRDVDQLAAVLAHELAHVTARHGAQQLSRRAVAARGVGIVRVVDPNLRHIGAAAARSAGLSLLRHSREHEEQADRLGLRYAHRAGYRVSAMTEVLAMLASYDRRTREQPRETWASTHPDPAVRQRNVATWIAQDYPGAVESNRGPDPLLDQLEGLAYGIDPRNGFTRNSTYHFPRYNIELDLPPGWRVDNNRRGVLTAPKDGDGLLAVLLTQLESAAAGTRAFFEDPAFSSDTTVREHLDGLVSEGTNFAFGSADPLAGRVVFVETPAGVWMLVGISDYGDWAELQQPLIASMRSFRRIADPAVRAIEPARLKIVQIQEKMRLQDVPGLGGRKPEVAWLNQVEPTAVLPAGTRLKVPVWPGPMITPK